ncbi:PPIP5K1, partial [Symbiodinium pilosum]
MRRSWPTRRSLVCIRTGWSARHREAERLLKDGSPGPWTPYHGKGAEEDVHPDYKLPRMHFPGVSAEVAEWLVQCRDMAGLGIDTLSPDAGASEGFKTHHAVLGADRYIVENLNLEGLPARGATVTVAPTALRGAPE